MDWKVEFSEKLRNSFGERGFKKLAAKVGMFFGTESCQQFSQERESNRGPWAYLYREIVNRKTRWLGGGEEGGAGLGYHAGSSSLHFDIVRTATILPVINPRKYFFKL
jgi:hypothetical protein